MIGHTNSHGRGSRVGVLQATPRRGGPTSVGPPQRHGTSGTKRYCVVALSRKATVVQRPLNTDN